MDASWILERCLSTLEGTVLEESWGEKGIFYNPGRGVCVPTVKEKDGDNDRASNLSRPGICRVSLGVGRATFQEMFGTLPKRPAAGHVVDMAHDIAALDTILPHPVYSWMGWICVLTPSPQTFARLEPLVQEAYELALEKFRKREPQPAFLLMEKPVSNRYKILGIGEETGVFLVLIVVLW